METGGSRRTTIRIGSRTYRGRDWAGALSFVPAGIERSGTYHGVDLAYTVLRISPSLERSLLGSDRSGTLSPLTNVLEPMVTCLLHSLGEDLVAGRAPALAYLEHLAALILCRLRGSPPQVGEVRRPRPLEPALVERTDEYICAHLGEDITVAALAGLCGMCPDTFARRFRASTGMAPYAYALARRIEHAQRLLRTSSAGLAAIALDLGFASQSHFTTTFRNAVGMTPARYRGQYRPKS